MPDFRAALAPVDRLIHAPRPDPWARMALFQALLNAGKRPRMPATPETLRLLELYRMELEAPADPILANRLATNSNPDRPDPFVEFLRGKNVAPEGTGASSYLIYLQ